MDAGPGREPVESIEYLCDAGVLWALGDKVFYSLHFFDMVIMNAVEYGVEIIYAASDFLLATNMAISCLNVCEYI